MIALAWPFVALCFAAVLWRALELVIATQRAKALFLATRAELAELQHNTSKAAGVLAERVREVEAQLAAISNHLQVGVRR